MSGALSNLIQKAESVLLRPQRYIGPIVADCTIEEIYDDRLEIVDHPVEQGAQITDHSFMQPWSLLVRAGWSNGSPANALSSLASVVGFGSESYVTDMYAALLNLQAQRIPFTILTGRRLYPNMLITSLSTHSTKDDAYSLFVELRCRQVILVPVITQQGAPIAQQATPASTAATQNTGTQQPQENQSILKQTGGYIGTVLKQLTGG